MPQKIMLSILLAVPFAMSTAAFADTTEDDVTWINQCIADNKREGATEDVVRKYCVCMDNAMAKDEFKIDHRVGEDPPRRDEGLRQGSRLEIAGWRRFRSPTTLIGGGSPPPSVHLARQAFAASRSV